MFESSLFIAVAVKAVTDALKKPIKEWKPELNLWWFYYVAFALGTAFGWFSGLNVLAEYPIGEVAGRIITALAIGGGPTMLHDLFAATVSRIKGDAKE